MSAVDIKFYEKKKSQSFYTALFLFLLVITITGVLYYYSYTQNNTLQTYKTTLTQVEKSISEIQKDEKIQIYSIYAENKDVFRQLAEWSKIPSMINHLKRVFSIQWVNYSWFSYRDGKATTELSLETNDSWYAYEKLTKFLKNYRGNEEALFTIGQISSFSWYDRINFSAELTLKTK